MSLSLYYYLAITGIYILMGWSLYLPYRVGQLHFMTVANMTISGYLGAYAALNWSWPFIPVLLLGALLGGLIGLLVSLAIGDAPCFAVVIVGFTFILISKTVVENTPALGGTMGLFGLPLLRPWVILAACYGTVLVAGFLIHRFDRSGLSRAAAAVFVNRDLAVSCGVNVKTLGMLLQTAGSTLGGISGVLYGYLMTSLFPEYFTFHLVGVCMTMLFVGGYSTLWGVVIATPLLWGIPLLFPPAVASWRMVIYGILLALVLILKPEGFITRRFVHNMERRIQHPSTGGE